MRLNRSKYASKKYPNLYKYPGRPFWIFRKYSKEKGDEFVFSTGESANEGAAYKKGLEEFDRWLGKVNVGSRVLLVRDLARGVLMAKEGSKGGAKGNNYRSVKNQIENHIIPAFGHMRPDQVTELRWEQYIADQRRLGFDRKFFNMRKVLMEILRKAYVDGQIRRLPDLKNPDDAPAPPRYLERQEIRRILHASPVGSRVKLLAFIMWKMGGRPGEILQYEWAMIRWEEGPHGTIHIPGGITKTGRSRAIPLNSRVSRVLRYLQARRRKINARNPKRCQPSPFIFPAVGDAQAPGKEYRRVWFQMCQRAGLDADMYNLRDTFITDCLMRGQSSTFVAKYVDSSTAMIDKMYSVAVKSAMEGVAG